MEHKEICDKLSPVLSKCSMHFVHITHIITPQNFYVRLTSSTYFLADDMDLSDNTRPDSLELGDVITYKSTKTTSRIRGKIMSAFNERDSCLYVVYAIDYGFVENNIKSEDIWLCNELYSRIPPLAYNCELENCFPVGDKWSERSIKAFEFYAVRETGRITIKEINDSKLLVQLVNTIDDIAKIMALTHYSTYVLTNNDVSKISIRPSPIRRYYPQKAFEVGDKLHVSVVRGRTLDEFHVAEKSEYTIYRRELRNRLSIFRDRAGLKEVEIGMPVIAIVNSLDCERGLVKEITPTGSSAIVELIDQGKTVKVSLINLRALPDSWLTHPLALKCRSLQTPDWIHRLHVILLRDYEFYITIKQLKTDTEPYIVDIALIK